MCDRPAFTYQAYTEMISLLREEEYRFVDYASAQNGGGHWQADDSAPRY